MSTGSGTYKLGKRPARHDRRTLRLNRYLFTEKLDAPPVSVDWTKKVAAWPMLMNDSLGDCTCAAAGHMIQAWQAAVGATFLPTDSETETMYEAVGGYVPGNPLTDNGADEITVLNYWRQTGFANRKISAYVAVNPQDATEVRQAISIFGGIYIGLAMPAAWQGKTTWSAPSDGMLARMWREMVGSSADWQPGSWGGHAVPILAYDRDGYTPITWGSANYRITNTGFRTYCDEAYAIVTEDFIGTGGLDPHGFDLAQLMDDLREVAQ